MKITIPYLYVTEDEVQESVKVFSNEEELLNYLIPIFKEPGKYAFDKHVKWFNSSAKFFEEHGYYTAALYKSHDYITYWEKEKEKCRKGLIIETADGKIWYISRYYYMWLNFLPIYRKDVKKISFAQVRDIQYHLSLYELLAELSKKHCVITKPRQIASSYYHVAVLINQLWFEESVILKLAAYSQKYINTDWTYLTEYRNFLNQNTGWIRPFLPDKVGHWKQAYKENKDGVDIIGGLKGELLGLTLDEDATKGVGGYCSYFFYEEVGVSPTFIDTFEFVIPSMTDGTVTTGTFIAAGTVGSNDQSGGLRRVMFSPDDYNMFKVDNRFIDDAGGFEKTGLFIPAFWGLVPFIDEFGNSLAENAHDYLYDEQNKLRKKLSSEQYQIRISQFPLTMDDAFSNRKDSFFPIYLIKGQKKRIENQEYPVEYLSLEYGEKNIIVPKTSNKLPIDSFPIDPKLENKESVLCVYERPDKRLPFGTYIASIDPVDVGKTISSESLCSIYVYKYPLTVVSIESEDNYQKRAFGDKIVASWCGRYDDLTKTHEQLEKIIEWYDAWTIVENNIHHFITYMIGKKKQKYLVPSSQIVFTKELTNSIKVFSDYGWRNTGILKKNLFIELKSFLTETIDEITDENGMLKTVYGIERIPDIMAMIEMEKYTTEKGNYDRLISLSALVSFARMLFNNKGFLTHYQSSNQQSLENTKKISNFNIREADSLMKNQLRQYKSYFKKLR